MVSKYKVALFGAAFFILAKIVVMIHMPPTSEFADYQLHYASKVDKDPFLQLSLQCDQMEDIINRLDDKNIEHAYAEGKWTVKQVLIHIMDAEQIFGYRALAIARGDKQVLPSFDHVAYIEENDFSHISREDLMRELCTVRDASVSMFRTFSEEQFARMGSVADYKTTPRAILYTMTGHTEHHLQILKERYSI